MINVLNAVLSALQIGIYEYPQYAGAFLQYIVCTVSHNDAAPFCGNVPDDFGLMKESLVIGRETVSNICGKPMQQTADAGIFRILKIAAVDGA